MQVLFLLSRYFISNQTYDGKRVHILLKVINRSLSETEVIIKYRS